MAKYNRGFFLNSKQLNILLIIICVVLALLLLLSKSAFDMYVKQHEMPATTSVKQEENFDWATAKVYKASFINTGSDLDFDHALDAVSLITGEDKYSMNVYHDKTFRDKKSNLYIATYKDISGVHQKSEFGEITVQAQAPELKPYLMSNSYCQTDSDCTGHSYYCSVGAGNQYQPVKIFGCESNGSVQGYTPEQLTEATKNCPVDEDIGPLYSANFTKAKCIDYSCVAQDMKITCRTATH